MNGLITTWIKNCGWERKKVNEIKNIHKKKDKMKKKEKKRKRKGKEKKKNEPKRTNSINSSTGSVKFQHDERLFDNWILKTGNHSAFNLYILSIYYFTSAYNQNYKKL